ncbi:putative replication factor C [Colletotrichum sublineola]|uniref:Putative replication factor C n=1 Tax=Colletotrichum sublineola TaxID=1173701 RepID=A0A066XT29_COLSU|nr:putative replication factor C [Colletotrichum sublineola]
MSDYEDEMDVDVPVSKDITFSSDAKQGKRSAANLPVEAEDSLPWVEKYRPVSLADVSGHQDILATINKFVDSNRLPHLLLYGPPGTGKTSTILALARRIYGAENMRQMVLELNASDDRGIDVVREQIKTFASTKQIFTLGPSAKSGGGGGGGSMASYKLIILDEADAMTNTAQMALRRIMEKYTVNTRFCIIANYSHKLSPALLSRCTPLQPKNSPKVAEGDIVREMISTETIYNCIAAPQPDAIQEILDVLLSTTDVTSCLTTINTLKTARGLALADIITALAEQLTALEVKPEIMIKWLEGLADIEHRVASGGSETVQTGAVVGVIRSGAELMSK